MGKTVSFNQFQKIEIDNYEEINEDLMRVRIRVCHSGDNANGFSLSKKSIEDALPTINYIPIVGEVIEYENGTSFGDHGIEEENGEVICNTVPFGVVASASDNEIIWETIDDKEYFSVTGYLWRRYQLVEKFESQDFYQSMEISINKSRKRRGTNFVDVSDFSFSALCILNKDLDNYENSVAPCFDKSNIKKFSKENTFNDALTELKGKVEAFNLKEGEEDMAKEKKKDEVEEVVEEVKTEEVTEETTETTEVVEETTEEETTEEVVEEEKEEEKEDEEFEKKKNCSLSLDEKTSLIREKLREETIEVEYWGEKYTECAFYFDTLFELDGVEVIVAYDNNFNNQYFIPFTMDKDTVTIDFTGKTRCLRTYRAFEEGQTVEEKTIEVFSNRINEVKAIFSKREDTLQTSINELEKYRQTVEFSKREENVKGVIAKFSFDESETEDLKVKATNGEMEIESLELHLFALAGKKALANKGTETQSEKEVVKFSKKQTNVNPYGGLVK